MASLIALASILLASVIGFVFLFHARLRKQKHQSAINQAAKASDDPLCEELLSKGGSASNISNAMSSAAEDVASEQKNQRP